MVDSTELWYINIPTLKDLKLLALGLCIKN